MYSRCESQGSFSPRKNWYCPVMEDELSREAFIVPCTLCTKLLLSSQQSGIILQQSDYLTVQLTPNGQCQAHSMPTKMGSKLKHCPWQHLPLAKCWGTVLRCKENQRGSDWSLQCHRIVSITTYVASLGSSVGLVVTPGYWRRNTGGYCTHPNAEPIRGKNMESMCTIGMMLVSLRLKAREKSVQKFPSS